MDVRILGNGVWGQALHSIVKENNPTTYLTDREERITDPDVLVISVPTQFIRAALDSVTLTKKIIVVNTAKGIEQDTHLLPHQIITSFFKQTLDYYCLIGPSFAGEVSQKMPTLVNLGFSNKNSNNESVKMLFQNDFFRVRLTEGIEILELSSAFKNIYAIACGIADGLGYGTNTRTKILVLAIEEMNKLFQSLKFKSNPNNLAGTVGDLILTCSSPESRNFTFGKLLTTVSVKKALRKVNSTVEGYHSLSSIAYFESKANIELNLAKFVHNVVLLDNPKKVKQSFEGFVKNT